METTQELKDATHLSLRTVLMFKGIKIFIITVPTPIDEYKKPDLSPLENATKQLALF